MTHSNRNFALAYVLLVALPICGLAGVLRSGRSLSAPISVSGVWRISANEDQLVANPCAKLLAGPNASFTISQSGKMFTLALPNAGVPTSSGAVEGTTISANLTPASASRDAACITQPITLTASVNSKTTPSSLQGVLRIENCANCTPIEFLATRDEQTKAKEAR